MKYEVRVCICGRIHVFSHEKIENAIYNDKELLLICGGCGSGTIIGADYRPNGAYGLDEPCYDMYSFTLDKTYSITSDFKTPDGHEISEIFFDEGIKVPMSACDHYILTNAVTVYSDNDIQSWLKEYGKLYRFSSAPTVATPTIEDKREKVLRNALTKLKELIEAGDGYVSKCLPAVFNVAAEESRYTYVPIAAAYTLTALYCKETGDIQVSMYDNIPWLGDRIARYNTSTELSIDDALSTFLNALPTEIAVLSICDGRDVDGFITIFREEFNLKVANYDKGKFHCVGGRKNGNSYVEGIYVNGERICYGDADTQTFVSAVIKQMC